LLGQYVKSFLAEHFQHTARDVQDQYFRTRNLVLGWFVFRAQQRKFTSSSSELNFFLGTFFLGNHFVVNPGEVRKGNVESLYNFYHNGQIQESIWRSCRQGIIFLHLQIA
jgi:hypothetical protein